MALVGSGGGSADVALSAPPPVATPAPQSSSCGRSAPLATGKQTITSDGIERSCWLTPAASYERAQTYPVIIGSHWRDGSTDDARG